MRGWNGDALSVNKVESRVANSAVGWVVRINSGAIGRRGNYNAISLSAGSEARNALNAVESKGVCVLAIIGQFSAVSRGDQEIALCTLVAPCGRCIRTVGVLKFAVIISIEGKIGSAGTGSRSDWLAVQIIALSRRQL